MLVAVGAASLAAGGFIALRRVPRGTRTVGPGHRADDHRRLCRLPWAERLFAAGVVWSAWLLPLPHGLAYPLGGALLVVGLVGYDAAPREFHSLRRNLGMKTDRLIMTGPYALPAAIPVDRVGAGAARCGDRGALGAALALTAIYWVGWCSDPGGGAGARTGVRRGVPQVSYGRAPVHAATTLPVKAKA